MRRQLLGVMRGLGGFSLARALSASGLRILCYHGFSFLDEHCFRPQLFMRPDLFEERIRTVVRQGFRVVSLDEAASALATGRSLRRSVVITIDDGFHGVHALAIPVLERLGLTATVYVTTYYVQHQNPIYRLCVQYMAWRSAGRSIDVSEVLPELGEGGTVRLAEEAGTALISRIIEWGETHADEPGRVALCKRLGESLDVDYDEIAASRRLGLMDAEQVRDLAQRGFGIELHTHRHRLPLDARVSSRELEENRAVLQSITGAAARHFCYPSGEWSSEHWPILESAGVLSATTCDPGINWPGTPPLCLRRFLDREDLAGVEFEAELAGVKDAVRRLIGFVR